jgi:exodeoxyribonuclease-3
MPLVIATWNINSVRLRINLVGKFLKTYQPDVLCLQEIKCRAEQFPAKAFGKFGYGHIAVNGQKGYHGVATVSRRPLDGIFRRSFCGKDDARHIAVNVIDGGQEIAIHNFYVPAGGDTPDPLINDKFAHKLAFLDEMAGWLKGPVTAGPAVLTGDLNIAPLEHDVWSHKQLLKIVSHTPVETGRLEAVQRAGTWTDAMRHFTPEEQKLYTWWSYRARDWRASNRGRRLDHVWVSRPLAPKLESMQVIEEPRDWPRPSDHVPVIVRLSS